MKDSSNLPQIIVSMADESDSAATDTEEESVVNTIRMYAKGATNNRSSR